MRKVLVTGGAGYIGSHTSKLLAANGYIPVCYDNLSEGHADLVKWGPLEIGELHDTKKLVDVINAHKPEAVIHFAASAYVGESVNNPFKYYKNNVGGTLSLLEAMKITKLKNIVFSSTCATYGIPEVDLIDEAHPQRPINPYGNTKLIVEKILHDLSINNDINYISLRYFNAAGADSEGEIGENHHPETHLIPLAIFSALRLEQEELQIFGTDFPTQDGTATRDYIHVEDLASAHLKALEYLKVNKTSNIFNLGVGKGVSVKKIISTLNELGLNVNFINSPRREGDPSCLVADASKSRTVLKWEPKYTHIKDILLTAVEWHKKNV